MSSAIMGNDFIHNRNEAETLIASHDGVRHASLGRVEKQVNKRHRLYRALRRKYVKVKSRFDQWLVAMCRRQGFLASCYYAFFSREFYREHVAMLTGKYRYSRDLTCPLETSALLRRNIHRLEKGLLMRPRRDLFGLDYIGETVACYERMHATRSEFPKLDCGTELQWAHDVLSQYFSVTIPHPQTASFRQRFKAISQSESRANALVPYRRDVESGPPVHWEQLNELAKRRRSVRWFSEATVSRESIDRAITIAAQSPSACNRQPFIFRIFDEPNLVRRVAKLPMGTKGYSHNIPAMAVIVGQLRHYPHERDRHLIYIDASLAAMSFIFALESQGLSSCCINWPDIAIREQKMATLLGLEQDERPVMCVAIGYPDPEGLVAYSQKKPLDQLRQYN